MVFNVFTCLLIFRCLFAHSSRPVLLFNLEELLWSWKLFEYIQFCHERFRNRSRRWIGLDTTINEELPPDLRAMDQMCLSIQFFLLGALHASGIVLAVLGYMLVLHKSHNIFSDPTVSPIFVIMMFAFNFGKRMVFKFADRYEIWMVAGEKNHDEIYDEGPGSRLQGALPPGMAAVDATLAECIEDAFAAGYTDETLTRLLTEAILYVPPGTAIQAATSDSAERMSCDRHQPDKGGTGVGAGTSHGIGTSARTSGVVAFDQNLAYASGAQGLALPFWLRGPQIPASTYWPSDSNNPGRLLPTGVPSSQSQHGEAVRGRIDASLTGDDGAFKNFMDAFRMELSEAKLKFERTDKFVYSEHIRRTEQEQTITQASSIFGEGPVNAMSVDVDGNGDWDDYDHWCHNSLDARTQKSLRVALNLVYALCFGRPDELVAAGIGNDEPHAGSTPTTSVTESSTSSTDFSGSDEELDEPSQYWPLELLVG